jgi:lactoylglutathione lyase
MHPSKEYGELEAGETLLSFIGEKMLSGLKLIGGVEYQKNRFGDRLIGSQIALITSDLERGYERVIAAGAVAVTPLDTKPWGQSVASVRDNNGFLVELCTPPISVAERLARLCSGQPVPFSCNRSAVPKAGLTGRASWPPCRARPAICRPAVAASDRSDRARASYF